MTKLGTLTGKTLYALLLAAMACVAAMATACLVGLVWTWLNPQTLWEEPFTVRYAGNVFVNWPNSADTRNIICFIGLGLCGLLSMIIVPLISLMRSAAEGRPFVAANIGRLHWIAAAFALVAIGRLILPIILPVVAVSIFGPDKPYFSWGPTMMVLVILVLAEVFREGVRLHDDVQATI